MRIEKFIKDKSNKYKVIIDGDSCILYDDVIIKYDLISKKEIDESLYKELISYNDELSSYYDSIKYITRKLRSEKEIVEYLKRKEIKKDIIDKTIKRLKENNFLNEELYIKAYINDQINLSNNGPKKIIKNLINLGIEEDVINETIMSIDKSIWLDKIVKYTEKKIKSNHHSSSDMLRMKILNELINLGYDKEDIVSVINKYKIDDNEILKRELVKATHELSKKYSGYELRQKILARLYRKGFKNVSIERECSYEE